MKSPRLRAIVIALFGNLLVVLPAMAVMVIVVVSPDKLDQGAYVFSVATNAAPNGTAVRVGIHLKTPDTPPAVSTRADLCLKLSHGGGVSYSDKQSNGQPLPTLTVTRRDQDMEASFVASDELLQNTNLYFTFSAVGVRSGQVVMPGGWIYELNLREFFRPVR